MIGWLEGTILNKNSKSLTLKCGYVGYNVYIEEKLLETLIVGQDKEFWIHTIVREDTLDLYGFETLPEHEFFQMLITISGIGPKSALTIIGLSGIGALANAIMNNDLGYLTSVSGIGKKTAEKIILELRDKIPKTSLADSSISQSRSDHEDVLDALIALGYSKEESRKLIEKIPSEITNTQEKIRYALKH